MSFLITKVLPENLKSDSQLVLPQIVLNKLHSNKRKKLILVNAPKGFGKTGIISLFVTEFKLAYSYYKTERDDDNLYTFLNYLINSIDKSVPGFIDEVKVLLDFYKSGFNKKNIANKNSITPFINELINHLYQFVKNDFYIVIEDSENISAHTWAHAFLNYFIANSPKNIHFIFITSSKFPFDETKFKLSRNFIEVTDRDLRIDAKIVSLIARNLYSIEISTERAKYIAAKTEGWLTGVHILLQSLSNNIEAPEDASLSETMFYYFEKEIMDGIEKKLANILILTSLFESFNESLLASVFKGTDLKYFFDELREKYSYIINKNKEGDFEYLAFFRDFLLEKVNAIYNEKIIKKTFSAAGNYYAAANDIERAVVYLALANDYKKLIPVIHKNIPKLIKSGDFNVVNQLLEKIPDSFFEEYPILEFYKALIYKNYYAEPDKALESFSICIKNQNKLPEEFKIKSYCYKAEVLWSKGNFKAALSLLLSIDLKKVTVKYRYMIRFQLVAVYSNMGKFSTAVKISEETLESFPKVLSPEVEVIRANILNTMGNINAAKGSYKKAFYYYDLCLKMTLPYHNYFQTLINYTFVSLFLGKFSVFEGVIEKLDTDSLVKKLPQISNWIEDATLQYFFEIGEHNKALQKADDIIDSSKKIKMNNTTLFAYIIKLKIFCYQNNAERTKDCLDLALSIKENISPNYTALVYLFLWINKNEFSRIKESLDGVNDSFDDKIFIFFRLCEVNLNLKKEKEAAEALNNAFVYSEKHEYYNCAVKEFLYRREIFDFAISRKLNINFIQNLISEMFNRRDYIADFEKIYDVKLFIFGIPQVFIRGVKIDDKKWTRNKFKEMFIYLILNKDTHITKDILVDKFFPDSELSYSNNIFHQFLSNMRSVLKVADSKYAPEFITYQNKFFEFNPDYIIDTDYNEFKKISRKINSFKSNVALKENLIEQIEKICTDEFMQGYYDTWTEDLRAAINSSRAKFIKELVKISKSNDNDEQTIKYYELLLKTDNLKEEYYIELIKCYMKEGSVENAKLKYKTMLEIFKNELGELPSPKALIELKDILLTD